MSDPTMPGGGDHEWGFDALDTALGERLRASAPSTPDADAALAGLRPGLARARRRHRAVVAGGAALCVAALVGLGAVVLQGGGAGDVKTPPATRPDSTTTAPTTVPTTLPDTTPTSLEAPGGTTPGTTPGTIDDHGGGNDSGSGSSGSGSSGSGSSGSGSSGSGGSDD